MRWWTPQPTQGLHVHLHVGLRARRVVPLHGRGPQGRRALEGSTAAALHGLGRCYMPAARWRAGHHRLPVLRYALRAGVLYRCGGVDCGYRCVDRWHELALWNRRGGLQEGVIFCRQHVAPLRLLLCGTHEPPWSVHCRLPRSCRGCSRSLRVPRCGGGSDGGGMCAGGAPPAWAGGRTGLCGTADVVARSR